MDSKKFTQILHIVAEYQPKPRVAAQRNQSGIHQDDSFVWLSRPSQTHCEDCDRVVQDRRVDFVKVTTAKENTVWKKKCLNCSIKKPKT